MQLTNGEIFNAKEPLAQLAKQQFPVKTSLALVKLIQELNTHLAPLEEVRNKLVMTYGTQDPKTPTAYNVTPGDEKWEEFAQQLNELFAMEVELKTEPVTLPDTLEIAPATILAIEKLIKIA